MPLQRSNSSKGRGKLIPQILDPSQMGKGDKSPAKMNSEMAVSFFGEDLVPQRSPQELMSPPQGILTPMGPPMPLAPPLLTSPVGLGPAGMMQLPGAGGKPPYQGAGGKPPYQMKPRPKPPPSPLLNDPLLNKGLVFTSQL